MAAALIDFGGTGNFNGQSILRPGFQLEFSVTVYSDSGLSNAHTSPVVLDRFGNLPTIYYDDASSFTVSIKDEYGNERANLSSPVDFDFLNTNDLKDDETFASTSSDEVASTRAIKTYVNDQTAGVDNVIQYTAQTISEDITIPDDTDACSFGDTVTIDDTYTVTVGSNSNWFIGVR